MTGILGWNTPRGRMHIYVAAAPGPERPGYRHITFNGCCGSITNRCPLGRITAFRREWIGLPFDSDHAGLFLPGGTEHGGSDGGGSFDP